MENGLVNANRIHKYIFQAQYFYSLKEKYDTAIIENEKNITIIQKLMLDIEILQKENVKNAASKEIQTFSDEIEFPCKKCIFIAYFEDELRCHMNTNHSYDIPEDETRISCIDCGKRFITKFQFMTHRKLEHPELINICRYFLQGNCAFDDKICWYSHKINKNTSSQLAQTLKEFNCGFCKKVFKSKPDFMMHRKIEHAQNISKCKEELYGVCRFSSEECWYKHQEKSSNFHIEQTNNHPPDMIKRLFDMMENIAERIGLIENQM